MRTISDERSKLVINKEKTNGKRNRLLQVISKRRGRLVEEANGSDICKTRSIVNGIKCGGDVKRVIMRIKNQRTM